MNLVVGDDGPHLAPSDAASAAMNDLSPRVSLEEEVDAMVADLKAVEMDLPDEVIRLCAGYMARCTEMHMQIVRVEGRDRQLKGFRTQQLSKVIELIEFLFRSSSRVVEVRRQEIEMSK